MIVDCGGGTVDLTTHKLLEDDKLDEIAERNGDFCGGSFVDEEFLRLIGRKVGSSAIKMVRENHYSQLQYMVQEFCRRVKIPFTGEESDFQSYDMDLKGQESSFHISFSIKKINSTNFFLFSS